MLISKEKKVCAKFINNYCWKQNNEFKKNNSLVIINLFKNKLINLKNWKTVGRCKLEENQDITVKFHNF